MSLGIGLRLGIAYGGGVPAWTPAKLSGLVAWFDAGDTSGVDGQNLATWTDKSGAGFHLNVQPAGANVFHASGGPNGKPYVAFSLGPLKRAAALVTGADAARTFYAVIKDTTEGHIAFLDGRYGFNGLGLGFGSTFLHAREAVISGDSVFKDSTSNDANAWEQIGLINVGGGSQRMRIGGAEHTLSGAAAVLASTTAFSIGGNDQGFAADSFIGGVAEFVACTGVLGSGDLALLEAFFATKYGV